MSREYSYDPFGNFKDKQEGVQYNGCVWEHWHVDDLAVGCHAECIGLEISAPTRLIAEAMSYNNYPPPVEVERRKEWLQSSLAPILHGILRPFSVPLEICQQIARYCSLRERATATARTFWQENSKTPDHVFNMAHELWACRVEFEGVHYIARLTNERGDQPASLIHTPEPGKEIDTMYMAEDHLGLREVFFVSSPDIPAVKHRPGLWWKTMKITGGTPFKARTDVSSS